MLKHFFIDSLTKAQKFASRALATSNIESGGEESDNDQTCPRKRTCIRSSMEKFPDYSETESMFTCFLFCSHAVLATKLSIMKLSDLISLHFVNIFGKLLFSNPCFWQSLVQYNSDSASCIDFDFALKFVLEGDDSDTEISFNATNSKRTPQLPEAPNFMSCSKVNSNLQLPPAWKSSGQTMENPIDLAGCSSTLPGNAMISAFNQILSSNPSSKQLIRLFKFLKVMDCCLLCVCQMRIANLLNSLSIPKDF